jgi:hypothetical protein
MTVSEIAIAAVAALVVMMAALVMILSISDREGRLPPEPRHARRPADPPELAGPATGQVPRPRAEHPGPFGQNNEGYAGPAGYGRQPGYGPPPLWGDARDSH